MLLHVEPDIICKLFHNDPDYASQTTNPIKHRLQFLSLAVIYQLHAPSIMRSMTGNNTSSYRDPDKMLWECIEAFP